MIDAKKWRFTPRMVADAPAYAGIYALWNGDELLKLGVARGPETIRDKLLAHLEASGAAATHYSWEITRSPERRAREILGVLESSQ